MQERVNRCAFTALLTGAACWLESGNLAGVLYAERLVFFCSLGMCSADGVVYPPPTPTPVKNVERPVSDELPW